MINLPSPLAPITIPENLRSQAEEARRCASSICSDAVAIVHSQSSDERERSNPWFELFAGQSLPQAILVFNAATGSVAFFAEDLPWSHQLWNGRSLSLTEAPELYGAPCFPAASLAGYVNQQLVAAPGLRLACDQPEVPSLAPLFSNCEPIALMNAFPGLRKSHSNAVALAKSCEIAALAHNHVALWTMRQSKRGMLGNERGQEREFLAFIAENGASGPSYPPICAAGANALCLHWNSNSSPIYPGSWTLCDLGCVYNSYCSDITRSFPANADFSGLKGLAYEILLRAQKMAIEAAVPGAPFNAPHLAAQKFLVAELLKVGLPLEAWAAYAPPYPPKTAARTQADESEDPRLAGLRAIFPHATSHFLGIETHDAGPAKNAEGVFCNLEAGNRITVEPGLYFHPGLPGLPNELAGLGMRIEDDILITCDSNINLTAQAIKEPHDYSELYRQA